MQLHDIKIKNRNKKPKRVGRGGKRGTYSGRGLKGQKARAGRKLRPEIRDIIKKLPKKRGYKTPSFKIKPRPVNLGLIEKLFEDGSKVNPIQLLKAGAVKRVKGKLPKVKILGSGELKKKVEISNCQFSALAKEKIEKAGGVIKDVE
jgi:large subunit ribosomal protein L15